MPLNTGFMVERNVPSGVYLNEDACIHSLSVHMGRSSSRRCPFRLGTVGMEFNA